MHRKWKQRNMSMMGMGSRGVAGAGLMWHPLSRRRSITLLSLFLGLAVLASTLALNPGRSRAAAAKSAAVKPTIVLIHGAWASSASWSGVIERLQAKGYTVDAPPNPLRSLKGDAAYVADFLKSIKGPIVLVGHSYGGAVITNAATGNPQVKELV
jgi:predicted alpha/beta-fold hydrolase